MNRYLCFSLLLLFICCDDSNDEPDKEKPDELWELFSTSRAGTLTLNLSDTVRANIRNEVAGFLGLPVEDPNVENLVNQIMLPLEEASSFDYFAIWSSEESGDTSGALILRGDGSFTLSGNVPLFGSEMFEAEYRNTYEHIALGGYWDEPSADSLFLETEQYQLGGFRYMDSDHQVRRLFLNQINQSSTSGEIPFELFPGVTPGVTIGIPFEVNSTLSFLFREDV